MNEFRLNSSIVTILESLSNNIQVLCYKCFYKGIIITKAKLEDVEFH